MPSMNPVITNTHDQTTMIRKSFLVSEKTLPLVIEPLHQELDLVKWVQQNIKTFESDLSKYGGILLRGFKIENLESFGRFVNSFDTQPIPYMFRSSPRHEIDKQVSNVYTSTTYPKGESIILHNESSYGRSWGMKIIFCCLQPAAQGGETPIADSRKIIKDIHPDLVNKFKEKGVMYRRKLIDKISMSWREVFQTDDRSLMEKTCLENGIRYEFISEEHLNIEWVKKAVYLHPKTGEETWFNHIYFFNKFSRYQELDVPFEEDLPDDFIFTDTLFGDGTPISIEEYNNIRAAYHKNTIAFSYQQGDIIFLDNMLVAHGRNPYQGDRTIATAILEPASDR